MYRRLTATTTKGLYMGQRVITLMTDDIDGTEFAEGEGRTVSFSFDNADYEIDLNDKNVNELRRALDPYIVAAREVSKRSGGARQRRASSGKSDRGYEVAAVKEWAAAQKIDFPKRGRLPQSLIERYLAAK